MMQAENLTVTFHPGTPAATPVLRGISLNIAEGEFITVIGSNGAGKSTLLNAISGDIMVNGGRIRIGGRDVTRLGARRLHPLRPGPPGDRHPGGGPRPFP